MSGGIEGIGSMGGSNEGRGRNRRQAGTPDEDPGSISALWQPPVAGVLLAAVAFASVFYTITDVVGGATFLLMELVVVAGLGVVAADRIRERAAVAVTLAGFVLALLAYFFSVPESQRALFTIGRVGADLLALVSGLSVLRLVNVGTWAVVIAPVPTFIVAYLAAQRRYVWAVTVASGTTGFFVLTGDAGPAIALTAAVGGALSLGLAGLSAAGLRGVEAQWDTLAVIVAAMIVVTSLLTVVPGSASNPVVPGGQSPSVESTLVTNDDRVSILGSITLSPEVRFVVQSEEPGYWRVGSYDRYTGDGWVRTGDARSYSGGLSGPPGDTVEVTQQFRMRGKLGAIPALWRPVQIEGETRSISQVTSNGGLVPSTALQTNETYTVTSERPEYTTRGLRRAGTNYPDAIQQRYTQLPSSTPDRVSQRTQAVVEEADASTPYAAAVAIEQYLESTKEYSLDVPNPSGNIADTFLFERDAGYCTYFATTMVTMLRSQGIPARFVTGYTTGQRVGPEEYVVRGLDSHAWVEVYFPEVGWVKFDPTPSAERSNSEQTALEEAREEGASNVDTADSEEGVYTTPPPTFTDAPDATDEANVTETPPGLGQIGRPDESTSNISTADDPFGDGFQVTTTGSGGSGEGEGGGLPSQRDTVLGVAALIGAVAGARRIGLTGRAYRFAWLVYQPSEDDPSRATERAYRRLEYLAERRYRPRAPGETPRQYVAALQRRGLDEEATAVARAFERAHYGPGVSAAEAEASIQTVDELVREGLPVVRRFGN
jgi:transglutaminase-like putative cysteine protease